MKHKHKPVQMMKVIGKLSAKEQAVCCFALQTYNAERFGMVHRGLLPFVNVDDVVDALDLTTDSRLIKALSSKLTQLVPSASNRGWDVMTLRLDDAKVVKRLGLHPERGVTLPMMAKKKVTAGLRWSLPKKDYEPNPDVMVRPHFQLKCRSKGVWELCCNPQHIRVVELWLIDFCR